MDLCHYPLSGNVRPDSSEFFYVLHSVAKCWWGGKALMPSWVMKITDITYAIAIAMTLLASISVTVQSFVRRRNKLPRRMVALILLGLAVISLCLRFL